MTEKFIESLERAKIFLQNADHFANVTFPLLKEKRLLLKILDELASSLVNIINAILQYEYTYKRIEIYSDARDNFNTFKRISSRYSVNQEQLNKIVNVLNLAEKHKKSPFEFVKEDKVVIMSNGFEIETLTLEKIKDFLAIVKYVNINVDLLIRERR